MVMEASASSLLGSVLFFLSCPARLVPIFWSCMIFHPRITSTSFTRLSRSREFDGKLLHQVAYTVHLLAARKTKWSLRWGEMLVACSRCGYGIFCVLPFRFVNLVRSHDTWRKIAVNPRRRHIVVGGMWRVEFSKVRWAAVDIGREDSADLGLFRNFSSQVHLLRSQKSKKQSSPLVILLCLSWLSICRSFSSWPFTALHFYHSSFAKTSDSCELHQSRQKFFEPNIISFLPQSLIIRPQQTQVQFHAY
jgi:hypothetical protein